MGGLAGLALRLLLYALVLWLGLYLLARGWADWRLRWTGLGLVAYAAALGLAVLTPAWPVLGQAARLLLITPALCWTGALLGFLPPTMQRERLIRLWGVVLWPLALLIGLLGRGQLTPWLALVILGPLLAVFGLVAATTYRLRTRNAVVLLWVATILVALATAFLFFPPLFPQATPGIGSTWVVMALGVDLLLLGFAVAALDAFEQGEGLALHMMRSLDGALVGCLLFGGPVVMTIWLGTGWSPAMVALLYGIVTVAIATQVFGRQVEAAIDGFAFRGHDQLTATRDDLRETASALPRLADAPALDWTDEAVLARHTRRALSQLNNLPGLAASPLTGLPVVVERAAASGEDHTLARAAALRALLVEGIARLKPSAGEVGFSDDWRYYNALYYPYVVGLKPYQRRPDYSRLDAQQREALAWFQSQVPERTLYNWQTTAAILVSQYLREVQQSAVDKAYVPAKAMS
jgi:hypothetical protein